MLKKILLGVLGVVIFLIIAMFLYLSLGQNRAFEEDLNYLNEVATFQEGYYSIDNDSENGFIFYPGAKVDSEAYAYLGDITNANVYIVDFPFNFAFFKPNAAQTIIDNEEDVNNWYIGGHSLGGVFAYEYASKHEDLIEGVVFLASYPASEIPKDSPLKVLSIYGTNDGVVGEYSEKMDLFNDNAKFVEIVGGNHSQFGNYGLQKGDNESGLSKDEQHQKVVEAIEKFIG